MRAVRASRRDGGGADGSVVASEISSGDAGATNHGPLSACVSGISVRTNGLGVAASMSMAGDDGGRRRAGAAPSPDRDANGSNARRKSATAGNRPLGSALIARNTITSSSAGMSIAARAPTAACRRRWS